ncbi:stress response protein NST1-like [Ornithorhynchus anatinus]|uniref:stress response protein NST1-like n=1 Tax=Ornithorhynchus anatinus TaxID=9258 RepID=UPI0019D437FC|nr:stress response protein NST1-like [Ornithorhynchus anatinus]
MPNAESNIASEEQKKEEDSAAGQETEQPPLLSGNPGSQLRDHGHHLLDSINTRLGQLQVLGLRDSGNQMAGENSAQSPASHAPQPAFRHNSRTIWGNTSRFFSSSSSNQRTRGELDTVEAQAEPSWKSPARTWRSGWHIANEEPFWWPEWTPPEGAAEGPGTDGTDPLQLQVSWEPQSRPVLALRAAEPEQEPGGRFEDPERCRTDREPEQLQGREEAAAGTAAAAWTLAAAPEKRREEHSQQLQVVQEVLEEKDATLAQLRQELGEARRSLLEEQSRWEGEKEVALQQQREMLEEQSRQAQAEAGMALETERQASQVLQGRVAELQAQVEQLERHVQQLQVEKEKETQLRLRLQEQLLEDSRVLREEANLERARDQEQWGAELQQLQAELREASGREEAVLAQLERADRAVVLACQQLQSLLPEPLASPPALAAAARG